MMHSIVIPYYNRATRLKLCFQSIERSAEATGIYEFEIVVVQRLPAGVEPNPNWYTAFRCGPGLKRYVTARTDDDGFNKCDALNRGIDLARGSILTFLDADAIVGPQWLEGVELLESNPSLTKLCYRVQLINDKYAKRWLQMTDWRGEHDALLSRYDEQRLAFEAYDHPYNGWHQGVVRHPPRGPHVYGNSQFSVRRADLGDLRFDAETFPRAGSEDIDFSHRFADRMGERYDAHIFRDPAHALLHFSGPHPRPEGWGGFEERQKEAYFRRHGEKRLAEAL